MLDKNSECPFKFNSIIMIMTMTMTMAMTMTMTMTTTTIMIMIMITITIMIMIIFIDLYCSNIIQGKRFSSARYIDSTRSVNPCIYCNSVHTTIPFQVDSELCRLICQCVREFRPEMGPGSHLFLVVLPFYTSVAHLGL